MQGREKEITLFSTVRSRVKASIGFVADERRINVGLTRAKCSLIVIGNAAALESDQRWRNLVHHAHTTGYDTADHHDPTVEPVQITLLSKHSTLDISVHWVLAIDSAHFGSGGCARFGNRSGMHRGGIWWMRPKAIAPGLW